MHVFGLQEEVGATTQTQGQVANLIQHGSNRAGDLTQNLASVGRCQLLHHCQSCLKNNQGKYMDRADVY